MAAEYSYPLTQMVAVDGRKADKAWKLVDELVEAVKILHPRMYTTFIDKVQDL